MTKSGNSEAQLEDNTSSVQIEETKRTRGKRCLSFRQLCSNAVKGVGMFLLFFWELPCTKLCCCILTCDPDVIGH